MVNSIELPVSKDIIRLEIEISIYIPSTQGIKVQKVLTQHEMDLRVKSVQRFLSKLFGGFTSFKAQGGYVLKTGQLVDENVTKVTAFADSPMTEEVTDALLTKCRYWAKKWGQETIGLEYEGDLYLIPR